MVYLLFTFLSMSSFGVYYFLVKILSIHITIPVIALISNAVALLVIYSYLYFTKVPILPDRKKYIVYSLIISVPVAIGLLVLYLAIQRGPISIVIPIYSLNAVITAIIGILILEETITVEKISGLV